ncbi:Probable inorganic phosphate transporter 1-9 [Linum perenne]
MALKVLSALDTARTQYYHFKATIVAGMGLFSDAYSLFCIPPITTMLARIYYPNSKSHLLPTAIAMTMIGIPLLGTAVGQLIFGYLGDRNGRRSVYGLALIIMVASSFGCGFSFCTTKGCVLGSLAFFRFLLGVGIGGDYPLSATIMSEFANKNSRGAFIAGVFSMQGFGILASSIVTVVVAKVFQVSSSGLSGGGTPAGADVAWRLILMLGAVPSALTYYWRMLMPETARYTALVENNVVQAARDMEKILDIPLCQIEEDNPLQPNTSTTTTTYVYNHNDESTSIPNTTFPLFSKPFLQRHGLNLFSCSANWFLLDIAFYSTNLFQSQIYNNFLKLDNKDVYEEAIRIAGFQGILALSSTIPGYYFTVLFIDRVGRRKIQFMGFFLMGLLYLGLGIPYSYWRENTNAGFFILYGLTFFFANFGPNTTTFIVPAELFPARFRSTCHGISGAMGKIGAVVGALGFQLAARTYVDGDGNPKTKPMRIALVVLSAVCFLGMVITYAFTPETMGSSLEENENDDQQPAVSN